MNLCRLRDRRFRFRKLGDLDRPASSFHTPLPSSNERDLDLDFDFLRRFFDLDLKRSLHVFLNSLYD